MEIKVGDKVKRVQKQPWEHGDGVFTVRGIGSYKLYTTIYLEGVSGLFYAEWFEIVHEIKLKTGDLVMPLTSEFVDEYTARYRFVDAIDDYTGMIKLEGVNVWQHHINFSIVRRKIPKSAPSLMDLKKGGESLCKIYQDGTIEFTESQSKTTVHVLGNVKSLTVDVVMNPRVELHYKFDTASQWSAAMVDELLESLGL